MGAVLLRCLRGACLYKIVNYIWDRGGCGVGGHTVHLPAVILTTGKWIKGGSPRILVDKFGRPDPDVFC